MKEKYIIQELIRTLKILTLAETIYVLYYAASGHGFIGWGQILSAFYQNSGQYPTYIPLIWFVPCTCTAKILFQLVLRITQAEPRRVFFLSVVLSITGLLYCKYVKVFLPWHIHTALFSQLFFAMGFLFHHYEDRLQEYEKLLLGLSTFFYVLLICKERMTIDLHLLICSDWSRYVITAVLGTIMIVLLSRRIGDAPEANPALLQKLLAYIRRNSLLFFAFQNYFITMSYTMINKLGASNDSLYALCFVVTMLSTVCLLSLCLIRDFVLELLEKKFNRQFNPII